ncbi:META domain-containing protein [Entomobacter blattae]|uniref:META domain protein n=1 Tax=Entomobacter blattae TaxID=2762277 RepID=A0A7H1NSC0_9PROT|nr:META domain-containing protein [Entomobacter blattae]QNT78680.1 META domain protein [Entomobacter blattae]
MPIIIAFLAIPPPHILSVMDMVYTSLKSALTNYKIGLSFSTFAFYAVMVSPLYILGSAYGVTAYAQQNPQQTPQKNRLTSTQWKLAFLYGNRVPDAKYNMEPRIVFDPAANRFMGSGTCNRFIGQYSSSGTSLTLHPVATTKRMCLDHTMMETENKFFTMLTQTVRYEITDRFLYFFDQSGKKIGQLSEKKIVTP